ncbi:unnamed protein product [Aureobasidium mustum]|uniref:Uncharacterized protein n=1 Tax=Aureobasidium mustum TaxID=2773714 RepID=A0A9N8JUV0_9PEZI|nr:unnamed protein product [Aureobasidium mustum]
MAIKTKSKAVLPTLAISFSFPDPSNALPPPHNHIPRFFHQHGVRGVLRIDVPATQLCDTVKITLQGQPISKIGSSQSVNGMVTMAVADSQYREDTFLELTDVHHLEHAAIFKKRLSYQTPFYFEIPTDSDPGHDLFKFNQFGLPPSLHAASSPYVSLHNGTWASVDIVYKLKPYAFRDDVLVFTGSQLIQLVPCVSSIPPPIAFDVFNSEYAMTRLQAPKKMFSKGDTLEVSLSEPTPLLLRDDAVPQ